jgi:hypothetical protein
LWRLLRPTHAFVEEEAQFSNITGFAINASVNRSFISTTALSEDICIGLFSHGCSVQRFLNEAINVVESYIQNVGFDMIVKSIDF